MDPALLSPFSLDARGGDGRGAARDRKKAAARAAPTVAEQQERLAGYLEIPAEFWWLLRAGTHVRYYVKDVAPPADYRSGGFVRAASIAGRDGALSIRFSRAPPGMAPAEGEWYARHDDIARLYAKLTAQEATLQRMLEQTVAGLNRNIRRVATGAGVPVASSAR
jgi:hypothetical protein